ncbi:hypothetical protein KM043_009493 [Ampulex compressa]|nr:hypothetical protein KM043_009493 [Ampulex compressa]
MQRYAEPCYVRMHTRQRRVDGWRLRLALTYSFARDRHLSAVDKQKVAPLPPRKGTTTYQCTCVNSYLRTTARKRQKYEERADKGHVKSEDAASSHGVFESNPDPSSLSDTVPPSSTTLSSSSSRP